MNNPQFIEVSQYIFSPVAKAELCDTFLLCIHENPFFTCMKLTGTFVRYYIGNNFI